MWRDKIFKTQKAMLHWLAVNENKIQWQEIYVNNAYGLTYKPLKILKLGE